jgi:hypothetical protein
LTINTTDVVGCEFSKAGTRNLPWPVPGGAALAVIVLIAVPRRRRSGAWLALVLLLMCFACGVSACGSGATTCGGVTGYSTPGAYTITVTGASGGSSSTGTVSLTVQ